MSEDQVATVETSSDEGPLDSLEGAQGEETISSDQTVEETQADGTAVEEESSVEDQLQGKQAEIDKLTQERDKALGGYNDLKSRHQVLESETAPYRAERQKDLQKRATDEAHFEKRQDEIGWLAALDERNDARAELVRNDERQRMNQEAFTQRDNNQFIQLQKKFTDAGKNESEFRDFVNTRNGFNGYTYKDANQVVDAFLGVEHAQKISTEAQENNARETETDLRRKLAGQTAKGGSAPGASKSQAGTAEAALADITTAKAQMDSVQDLM